MRKTIALIVLCAGALIAGCTANPVSNSPPGSSTPLAKVAAADAGFTALLAVAAQYTSLPRCGAPASPPVCSDPSAVVEIRKAANSGVAVIDAAYATVQTPGATTNTVTAAIAGAVNATGALKSVLQIYNIKTGSGS